MRVMVSRDLRAVGLGLFPQQAEAFFVPVARELHAGGQRTWVAGGRRLRLTGPDSGVRLSSVAGVGFCMHITRQNAHNLPAERPTRGWHLHRAVRDDPGLRDGSRPGSNVPENHQDEPSRAIAVTGDTFLIE
jgi:hypothetical protein